MSQQKSTTNVGKITGWNQAISEAENMLNRVKRKAKRLEAHISSMKESRNVGEPWEQEKEKAGTHSDSVPA